MLFIILIASLMNAITTYLDKYLVNLGITKKDYFYYICLSTIPFSLFMIFLEYLSHSLRFEISIIPILLLILAMYFRYLKQNSIVGCLKYLKPYEDSAYLSLNLIIAFLIDVILKIEKFKFISLISILLTILGVFLIANSKLKIRNLQKDLIKRILTSLIMNYLTHYILTYWSTAPFMLLMNFLLVLLFSKDYKVKYHLEHKKIINWVFMEQIFGFTALYLSNYLARISVTKSIYVRPISIVLVLVISMFLKDKKKRPSFKEILGIILVILGIILITK